jgi:phospholipase/carboxylesterase
MPDHDLILQRPAPPTQLVLLFHGVGASARNLVPLGEALAAHLPQAAIVSVQAPDAMGPGWQWFSVQGVTEANRPARVLAAMPRYMRAIQQWQAACGVDAQRTTLIGFSQGAIMALESTQLESPLAHRVIAIAGRYARPPRVAHASIRTHLMHGDADAVMPVRGAIEALAQLQGLGAFATLDRFPGLGHGIDGRVVDAIIRRLDGAVQCETDTAPLRWLTLSALGAGLCVVRPCPEERSAAGPVERLHVLEDHVDVVSVRPRVTNDALCDLGCDLFLLRMILAFEPTDSYDRHLRLL